MFIDVCIPKNNEKEFIMTAEKIDTKGILFLYEKDESARILELQKSTKLQLFSGFIITKNSSRPGINFAKAEQQNIENRNLKFMYGFETVEEKDSFHFRRSGANQVLSSLMKEKDKVMVFDMEKIITQERGREKLTGRMIQNLMLADKYKLDCIICSFATKPENLRAEEEYASFVRALGYQEIAKKSTALLSEILKNNDL